LVEKYKKNLSLGDSLGDSIPNILRDSGLRGVAHKQMLKKVKKKETYLYLAVKRTERKNIELKSKGKKRL
jgi:hypothetical protein